MATSNGSDPRTVLANIYQSSATAGRDRYLVCREVPMRSTTMAWLRAILPRLSPKSMDAWEQWEEKGSNDGSCFLRCCSYSLKGDKTIIQSLITRQAWHVLGTEAARGCGYKGRGSGGLGGGW